MKIVFVVAYFGTLPGYFQLFLDSCAWNPDYAWLIFTDDQTAFQYPSNVKRIEMTFEECRTRFRSKFDFEITLDTPQKLCDYKCAYGYLFEEYLVGYDWWGHCDIDQIFGRLGNFISEDMFEKYDKLFSLGHMTLYRNTPDNNRQFTAMLNGRCRYKEVFTTARGCGFDEWLPDNVNDIYLQSERPVMLDNIGADIHPYKTTFTTVEYRIEQRRYECSRLENTIFQCENRRLYQIYIEGRAVRRREYPYVHLQKRRMWDKRTEEFRRNYFIIPNCFLNADQDAIRLIRSCKKWKWLNYQFLYVKWKSLKYRIKNRDWKFDNIFKKQAGRKFENKKQQGSRKHKN